VNDINFLRLWTPSAFCGEMQAGVYDSMDLPRQGLWEREHFRFGMAGEGQADCIQSYLLHKRGRILYVGCGLPDSKFENLAEYALEVVAIDHDPDTVRLAKEEVTGLPNVRFEVADARYLQLEPSSFDCILALGLFAYIHPHEIDGVFLGFSRVCREQGYLMVTNATSRPKQVYVESAARSGFELLVDREGYCPAASTQRRYLLVFRKSSAIPFHAETV
jgi:ubiquinone/menaquinone biosynthesis C-methylase UbiE